jgi:hypothetical protein
MTGAWAQVWVDKTAQAIDSVTVGVRVPYYVQPDQYFNPATTAYTDTADVALISTFAWDFTAFATAPTKVWQSSNFDGGNDGNSVMVVFNAVNAAPENISVIETATSCPGTAVTLPVRVIASPTIAFNPTVAGTIIGANATFCDGDPQQDDILRVVFTGSLAGNPRYTLDYTYSVDTWNSGTSSWDAVTSVDHTGASAITAINTGTYDLNDHTSDFAIIAGSTTRYTYTISGVTDRISRKSDYLINPLSALATWRRYDLGPETITVTVNPAPVTGPIYHISNMWAN